MMPEAKPASKKGLFIKAGVLGAVVLAAAVLVLWGVDLKALLVQIMAIIGDAGPWVFFTGVALLPACGFPLMAFTLTVGPAFGAQLGLGGVLAAYGAAVGINLALTYWLACYALRPWVERLVARAGYKIPQLEEKEHLEVTLLLRITPGPPFFLQSYLLGLGRVTFLTYLWVSWTVAMAYAVGAVCFGKAIVEGRAGLAVMGVCLLIAAGIIVHLVRKHYGKGRVQAVR
ncbi:MAG: VTT domain-containing protein [Opitutaceae bacterium]